MPCRADRETYQRMDLIEVGLESIERRLDWYEPD
jgi:hypothetical protein